MVANRTPMTPNRRQRRLEQLTIPYEQRGLWEGLPEHVRQQARQLLAELVLAVDNAGPTEGEQCHEEREDNR